jgi:hypothetical protein
MEESQDNSQRDGTDQTSDLLSISLSQNAFRAHFGTSIQINGRNAGLRTTRFSNNGICMAASRNRAQPILSIREGFLFRCGISRNSISFGRYRYRVGPIQICREIEAFVYKGVMDEPRRNGR